MPTFVRGKLTQRSRYKCYRRYHNRYKENAASADNNGFFKFAHLLSDLGDVQCCMRGAGGGDCFVRCALSSCQ